MLARQQAVDGLAQQQQNQQQHQVQARCTE